MHCGCTRGWHYFKTILSFLTTAIIRLAEDLEQRRLTIQRGLVRDSQLLEAKVAGMRETKAFIEKTLGAIIKRRILVTGDLLSASAKA